LGYADHGVSLKGGLKYKENFKHFDYINENAPKKGRIRISSLLPFDSLNPFIIKGNAAPHIMMTFATLFEPSEDEPASVYAYVAESVEISSDHRSVIFHLNPAAAFSDGVPLTSEDVAFSFNILKTQGHPKFQQDYEDVESVKIHSLYKVEFLIKNPQNKQIPYFLARLPILPSHFYKKNPFDETSLVIMPTAGPYVIKVVQPGQRIVYELNEKWWGRNLPTQKGRHNFKFIENCVFRDDNARLEAFKSHQTDLRAEMSIQTWVKKYNFPAYNNKRVKKIVIPHKLPKPTGGIILNTRKKHLDVRNVRKALDLMFDFNWCNKNHFYNLMHRSHTYFALSPFDSQGKRSAEILQNLEPYKGRLPSYVFEEDVPLISYEVKNRHDIAKQAHKLFEESGYLIKNQKIIDPTTNNPLKFVFIIESNRIEKIALFYKEHLQKFLGISVRVLLLDKQSYIKRIQNFDFDMALDSTYTPLLLSLTPGQELRSYFSARCAKIEGGLNYSGINDPVIDDLIEKIINESSDSKIQSYMKTLDFLLMQGYYRILSWYFDGLMIAYWDNIAGFENVVPYPQNYIARLWDNT
jgi:microcin C transport system substrate-binding protein